MNVAILSGRIAQDFKVADSGKVATVGLACNRPYPFNKDRDGKDVADFLTLRFIGEKNVDRATKYLNKGTKIDVRGVVCRDNWQKDGSWQEMNYIIVQEWEFAESKAAAQQNGSGGGQQGQTKQETQPAPDDFLNVDDSVEDSGIPFA